MGATAIAIGDGQAAALIANHFPKLQAAEFKYRALARRPPNRDHFMALQHAVLPRLK